MISKTRQPKAQCLHSFREIIIIHFNLRIFSLAMNLHPLLIILLCLTHWRNARQPGSKEKRFCYLNLTYHLGEKLPNCNSASKIKDRYVCKLIEIFFYSGYLNLNKVRECSSQKQSGCSSKQLSKDMMHILSELWRVNHFSEDI